MDEIVGGKKKSRKRKPPSGPPPVERMYRGSEVAAMLGISESQVRRLADTGGLKCLRLSRSVGHRCAVIYPESFLKAYVEERKAQAEAKAAKWRAS